MPLVIRIGTRGSQLALWQANWVADALQEKNPDLTTELAVIKTKGDKIQNVPLGEIGGKALFIKEIEEALLRGSIDVAVHSMKDMPTDIPHGLSVGAVPKRELTNDVLMSQNGLSLSDMPSGSRIGTGSLRRKALLQYAKPDLRIVPIRGNIDTRIRKLETENLSAIVLAAAGVHRLGWQERITEYLPENIMLPAVGQGALAIEIRQEDPHTASVVEKLNHQPSKRAVAEERAFLGRLGGSCHVPIAALARSDGERLTLDGLVADVDGKTVFRERISGKDNPSLDLGKRLADGLLEQGADRIIASYDETF